MCRQAAVGVAVAAAHAEAVDVAGLQVELPVLPPVLEAAEGAAQQFTGPAEASDCLTISVPLRITNCSIATRTWNHAW